MFSNTFRVVSKGVLLFFCILGTSGAEAEGPCTKANVPLKENEWVVLSYDKIPANQVSFAGDQLTIKVKKSAGPIVHKLSPARKISEVIVRGKVTGVKQLETGPFDEDSSLRLGLVAVGTQTLSGPKRWFAADWVKKLFALAPEGTGLDKIYFYNLTNRQDFLGKQRAHPKSDLIDEKVVGIVEADGKFQLKQLNSVPTLAAALWISVDGDDTKSEFETAISEIQLCIVP